MKYHAHCGTWNIRGNYCLCCRRHVRLGVKEEFRPVMASIKLTNKKEWNLINRNEVAK